MNPERTPPADRSPRSAEQGDAAHEAQAGNDPGDSPRHPAFIPAGTALGPFIVDHPISIGGMGVIYKAVDTRDQRQVALKAVRPDSEDPKAEEHMAYEATVHEKLVDPNIVPAHHLIVEGRHFIVMPLHDGTTLETFFHNQPWLPIDASQEETHEMDPSAGELHTFDAPLENHYEFEMPQQSSFSFENNHTYFFFSAFCDLCGALAKTHAEGFVHRDVKPKNVLLDHDYTGLLSDFGATAPSVANTNLGAELLRLMLYSGDQLSKKIPRGFDEVTGSADYLAPEAVAHQPIDHRNDLYALGVILYRYTTGSPPYYTTEAATKSPSEGQDPIQPSIAVEIIPPRQIDAAIPEKLEHVILKLLEKDPDRRYDTVGEMFKDLQRALPEKYLEQEDHIPKERIPPKVLPTRQEKTGWRSWWERISHMIRRSPHHEE